MKTSLLGRVWALVKWPLGALLVIFIGLCIYYIHIGGQIVKTREAVARIHATRLTHEDVFGAIVAVPDPTENNKTLAGIDANNNGIRDDVELAIYHAHQDSATTTAAMLQYAKELQLEFTSVFNSETLVAVIQEEGRGDLCIVQASSDFKTSNARSREVEALVFDTDERKKAHEDIFSKYMTTYSLLNNQACDLEL